VTGRGALLLAVLLAAPLVWAQSRVGCGPAQHGCGPAIVQGAAAIPTAPPSWVSAMLAAWMLDEASGTRTNAQGTTSRNLTDTGGVGNDTTNKMQGAAAALFTNAVGFALTTPDAGLENLVSPLSLGCWVRPASTKTNMFLQGRPSATNNVLIDQDLSNWVFYIYSNAHSISAPSVQNTFSHVVGTYAEPAMKLYVNGALAATGSSGITLATTTTPWEISDAGASYVWGQVDECFVTNVALSAASVCRICSCGLDGALCTCNGTAFTTTGRNATACGACTLPADCSAAAPS
jgi:hypothetical protein